MDGEALLMGLWKFNENKLNNESWLLLFMNFMKMFPNSTGENRERR